MNKDVAYSTFINNYSYLLEGDNKHNRELWPEEDLVYIDSSTNLKVHLDKDNIGKAICYPVLEGKSNEDAAFTLFSAKTKYDENLGPCNFYIPRGIIPDRCTTCGYLEMEHSTYESTKFDYYNN